MKKLIFLALFYFLAANCIAQGTINTNVNSKYLIRSTVGINGLSKTLNTNKETFFIQQSIGQASVIGTYSKNDYTIRQGFLQPINTIKILPVNTEEENLNLVLYPNPFHQSLNISINEYITNDLFIVIYNISGSIVFSKKYAASQQINIPLNYLPKGDYFLKITTEDKKLVSKLIKL